MPPKSSVELVITSRPRDLGGFSVRRILPYATHRAVGPFIFFDHMGPATFAPGQGMDVRPHPHINLATVSYLFEGRIGHRDSLGSDLVIEPGAINWMTAGRGIVHSERTPPAARAAGGRLNGIQLWVALPDACEEMAPTFAHHPKDTLPEFVLGDARVKLLLGEALGHRSPVTVHSDLYYLEAFVPAGSRLTVPGAGRENAVYVVGGEVRVEDAVADATSMVITARGADVVVDAVRDAHVMLIGGSPLGARHMYWNFVSSSKARLDDAKRAWSAGPAADNPRFTPIPGDADEFIPLPDEPGNPKGTIL